jgi:hypothetical protein
MESQSRPLFVVELDERVVPSATAVDLLANLGPFRTFGNAHHVVHHTNHQTSHHNTTAHHTAKHPTASHTPATPAHHKHRHASHHNHHHAHGDASGTYTTTVVGGDLGKTYELVGQIRMPGVGPGVMTVSGSLHTLGNVLQGRAGGDLTLSAPSGSITLHLTGVPQQSSSDPLPTDFNFRVVGGTGHFAHTTGQGLMQIALNPADQTSGTFQVGFINRSGLASTTAV